MLSPCVRQVTHALLTRPPLTFESLGFIKSPFDLHVLSTPPAFILSQDQTLMLKVLSFQNYLATSFIWYFYCFFGWILKSLNSQILFSFLLLWNSPDELFCFNSSYLSNSVRFGIFRVALLFICQGSFKSFHWFVLLFAVVLSSNSVIISQCFASVNNFFNFFKTFFEAHF